MKWSKSNHLQLNISKPKVVFQMKKPHLQPVSIQGVNVELVKTYKYLGLQVDNSLEWTPHMDIPRRKRQSRLYFLRRLGSFNICKKLLLMFYQTVVASVIFYAVVCWGENRKKRDRAQLDIIGEEGCLGGGHRAELTGNSGREEDTGETTLHPGSYPPSFAQHIHQAGECVQ